MLVLVKLVIAAAFCLNVSRKISEERSALRRDFYNKFVKVSVFTLKFFIT